MKVSELTKDHHGWLIRVAEPAGSLLPHRTFTLGRGFGCGVRSWEHDGQSFVGLTDDVRSPGIVGTERIYLADTECELLRPVSAAAKRAARQQPVNTSAAEGITGGRR